MSDELKQAVDKLRRAAEKVLELDPNFPSGYWIEDAISEAFINKGYSVYCDIHSPTRIQ